MLENKNTYYMSKNLRCNRKAKGFLILDKRHLTMCSDCAVLDVGNDRMVFVGAEKVFKSLIGCILADDGINAKADSGVSHRRN